MCDVSEGLVCFLSSIYLSVVRIVFVDVDSTKGDPLLSNICDDNQHVFDASFLRALLASSQRDCNLSDCCLLDSLFQIDTGFRIHCQSEKKLTESSKVKQ